LTDSATFRPEIAVVEAAARGWRTGVFEVAERYESGLAEGRLVLPFCAGCDVYLPPWISRCASHWSDGVELLEVAGAARIWSWVVYHRQYGLPVDLIAPYTVVSVDLDRGPRLHGVLHAPEGFDPKRGVEVDVDADTTARTGALTFRPVV
jgi:uncharacterized OB-fold protein